MSTIPVGLATKAGLSSALGLFVAALVAAITDQTPEAIAGVAAATLSLLTVLGGRYAQAAATVRQTVAAIDDGDDGIDLALEHAALAKPIDQPGVPDVDAQSELA